VLLRALTERHPKLGAHAMRVSELAEASARKLGLSDKDVEQARLTGRLHDVGKMAIPDVILDKPGPLTEDEWKFVRDHSKIGERILHGAPDLVSVAGLVRSSLERFDGSGYPDGLVGHAIPLEARIISCCDAFSAITTDRSYRKARSAGAALEELQRCAGSQFDPRVVDAAVAVTQRKMERELSAAALLPDPLAMAVTDSPRA
jgi:putative nucleotidyltransferase with HDIG domain